MKLLDLAKQAIRLLKESGDEGIRSDVLADILKTPKRRVYDVIAVLKAMSFVSTKRRYDGTTVTWLDPTRDYVHKSDHEQLKTLLTEVDSDRKQLQVMVAELKEEVRLVRSKVRQDIPAVASTRKVEFDTSQLTVRCLRNTGFKKVRDSGMEVVIESYDSGIAVDPTEVEHDENEALIRSIRRI